jgi:hypothetical protein
VTLNAAAIARLCASLEDRLAPDPGRIPGSSQVDGVGPDGGLVCGLAWDNVAWSGAVSSRNGADCRVEDGPPAESKGRWPQICTAEVRGSNPLGSTRGGPVRGWVAGPSEGLVYWKSARGSTGCCGVANAHDGTRRTTSSVTRGFQSHSAGRRLLTCLRLCGLGGCRALFRPL